MSRTLNGWLERGATATKPCEHFTALELQQLQVSVRMCASCPVRRQAKRATRVACGRGPHAKGAKVICGTVTDPKRSSQFIVLLFFFSYFLVYQNHVDPDRYRHGLDAAPRHL